MAVLKKEVNRDQATKLGEVLKKHSGFVTSFTIGGKLFTTPMSITKIRSKKQMSNFLDKVVNTLNEKFMLDIPSQEDYSLLVEELGVKKATEILDKQFLMKLSTVPPIDIQKL